MFSYIIAPINGFNTQDEGCLWEINSDRTPGDKIFCRNLYCIWSPGSEFWHIMDIQMWKKWFLKTWKCLIPLGFSTSPSWGKPMMGAYVWPQLVPLKFKVLFSNLNNTPIASTQYAMLWVCSDNWKHGGTIYSREPSQISPPSKGIAQFAVFVNLRGSSKKQILRDQGVLSFPNKLQVGFKQKEKNIYENKYGIFSHNFILSSLEGHT